MKGASSSQKRLRVRVIRLVRLATDQPQLLPFLPLLPEEAATAEQEAEDEEADGDADAKQGGERERVGAANLHLVAEKAMYPRKLKQ